MWKARLLTVCAALAAALVAARPAAAQEGEQPDLKVLTGVQAAGGAQCKLIPILALPGHTDLFVPPSTVASLSKQGCVCWNAFPPREEWEVSFHFGTPFFAGQTVFTHDYPCGVLVSTGVYKYDVSVTDFPVLDPWLDVTP